MSRPRVLVTGSGGLIGRILLERLRPAFDMIGLDRNGPGDDRHLNADIAMLPALHAAVDSAMPIDRIVHLAADSRVHADWESVLRDNIAGTRNVYECARRHRISRVVFASSSHVTGAYGTSRIITVSDPVRPDGDYGSSKAVGEVIARQYRDLHGISSICLRIGWVIGNDDPTISEEARQMWLSHRDLAQLMTKSLVSDVPFGIYYGLSRNRTTFWDISSTERELGYAPRDDGYAVATPVVRRALRSLRRLAGGR